MSAVVQHATRHALLAPHYRTISDTLGVTAIVLLLVLLLGREMVRAAAAPGTERRLRALTMVIVPLLLCFAALEAARFVYLIGV